MRYAVRQIKDIYKGKIITVRKTYLTGGRRSFWREIVVHPGAVAVLPVLSPDKIILVRQFRYAPGRSLWEIPAGTLEKGESPLQCVRRELAEETGYTAKSFSKIAEFYPCPGYSSERIHLYRAEKLTTAPAVPDEDEDISIKVFSRREIRGLLDRQQLIDAKTLIALMLWLKKRT